MNVKWKNGFFVIKSHLNFWQICFHISAFDKTPRIHKITYHDYKKPQKNKFEIKKYVKSILIV